MRDTSEYLELIGRLDAVILINWHLYTLERQIQNGSKVRRLFLKTKKLHVVGILQILTHLFLARINQPVIGTN